MTIWQHTGLGIIATILGYLVLSYMVMRARGEKELEDKIGTLLLLAILFGTGVGLL